MCIRDSFSRTHISEKVQKKASRLLTQYLNSGDKIRGRKTYDVIAGVFYAAGKLVGEPLDLRKLTAITGLRRKNIHAVFRDVFWTLDLKLPLPSKKSTIQILFDDLCKVLEIKEETKDYMLKAYSKIPEGLRAGKDIKSQVSAVIYLTCLYGEGWMKEKKLTQRQVAQACNRSEVTIRNRAAEKGMREIILKTLKEYHLSVCTNVNKKFKKPYHNHCNFCREEIWLREEK